MASERLSAGFVNFLEYIIEDIEESLSYHSSKIIPDISIACVIKNTKPFLMLTDYEISDLFVKMDGIHRFDLLNEALNQIGTEYHLLKRKSLPSQESKKLYGCILDISYPLSTDGEFASYEELDKYSDFERLVYQTIANRALLLFLNMYDNGRHKDDLKLCFCSGLAKTAYMDDNYLPDQLAFLLRNHYDTFYLDDHFNISEETIKAFNDLFQIDLRQLAQDELEAKLISEGVNPKISRRFAERKTKDLFSVGEEEGQSVREFYNVFFSKYPDPRDFMDDIFVRIGNGADISRE